MSVRDPRPYEAVNTLLEVRAEGSTSWKALQGVGDISVSGGEPDTTETQTFFKKTLSVGLPGAESLTIELPGVSIPHSTFDLLTSAKRDGKNVFVRWSNPEEVLFPETASGVTVSIATSGAVTKAGTASSHPDMLDDAFGPGDAIKVGTAFYVIETIGGTGATPSGDIEDVTLKSNPGSAVSASVYSIVKPPIYQPEFSARVGALSISRTAGGAITGSLSLLPKSQLPAERVGTP